MAQAFWPERMPAAALRKFSLKEVSYKARINKILLKLN